MEQEKITLLGHKSKRAVLGIEPRTSCTQSKNHTTRPNSHSLWLQKSDHCQKVGNKNNHCCTHININKTARKSIQKTTTLNLKKQQRYMHTHTHPYSNGAT
eukprot:Blabericola_migrator_1__12488@NODE_78_length_15130_cov_126_174401_g70_i0_p13_GENE_NODE_78_length_15130_cov_126_174401_g70_i0NODE_78_length_15130_cov_126_174401_g70_i0_p13_ORF_typecomplete_len101_score0_43TLV_coat/PF00429_19/0_0089_NODE_78_length_15130_cov_126_174401_g70_i028843186